MNKTNWVLAGAAGLLGLLTVLFHESDPIMEPLSHTRKGLKPEFPKENRNYYLGSPASFEVRAIRPPKAEGSALERPFAPQVGGPNDEAILRSQSLSPEVWVHEGDSDGDGLTDEFEIRHGLDPHKVDTWGNGIPDEERIAPDGRTYGAIQLAEQNGEPCRHQAWASTPSR